MKNLSRMAVMAICLLLTAIFTSACGGGKSNPPNNSAFYYLLAQQQNNEQQNNEQQNNEQQNNEQEENNNEEEPVANTAITLTLIDSLNADKIASADIYYSVNSTTKKSSVDDKEILKATPNADDNTKFTVTFSETNDPDNVKIKAVITYDSEENCLDYFSSYEGKEATNGNFDIDFENKNGDFAGGTGTEDDPYLISQPRHFVNINKQDDQEDHLYLTKNYCYKQTTDIDFTHLTGLKIVNADDDKDITIETVNEKAPLYNDGHGIEPIGKGENPFIGSYDGDNHTIDGLILVNPDTNIISLFNHIFINQISTEPEYGIRPQIRPIQTEPIQTEPIQTEPIQTEPILISEPIQTEITNKELLKNLTIGKNSIFFIDENKEIYNQILMVSLITSINPSRPMSSNEPTYITDNLENTEDIVNIENNAKIIVKNIESNQCLISGITPLISNMTLNNCTNNGNITIYNNKFNGDLYVNGIANSGSIFSLINSQENEGNQLQMMYAILLMSTLQNQQINKISNCTNYGHITITNCESNSPDNNFQAYVSGILGNNMSPKEASIIMLLIMHFSNGNNNLLTTTTTTPIPTNSDTITNCTNNGHILISENKDMSLFSSGIMSNLILGISKINIDNLTNNGYITITDNTLSETNTNSNKICVSKIFSIFSNMEMSYNDSIKNTGKMTIEDNDERYKFEDNYIGEDELFLLLPLGFNNRL